MIRASARGALIVAAVCVVAVESQTLPPAAMPVTEGAGLAQGWALLAEGKLEEAARTARDIQTRAPRNISAFALTVEVEIARAGGLAALTVYEAWLGQRQLEEPGVLRRVARAFLYEWGRQEQDAGARSEALLALAQDGETLAHDVLASAGEKSEAALVALARLGDRSAVNRISAQLTSEPGLKLREIRMLADSRSRDAVPALLETLNDPRPENRAAAADALGKIGDRVALDPLRKLLEDRHGAVCISAAGALYAMGDPAGAPVLLQLAASEHASVRRSAAALLAPQPDETWKTLVRGLASDPDPSIRLDAARMLAVHEPGLARSILDALLTDPNYAIREEASLALAESGASDFQTLRRLLRAGGGRAKVRAAARILSIAR
jgi:HEAT repeat protein